MRSLFPAVMALLLFVSPAYAALFGIFGDSTETVVAEDGEITLDVAGIRPSDARHYRYREGKISVKFFVARDRHGAVRAAVDACEVCWKAGKGYVVREDAMLCLNCGRKFPLERIGILTGGCNPHPLKFTLDNNSLTVRAREALLGAAYFPENKQ
jgi:uncharacterized membrane protein